MAYFAFPGATANVSWLAGVVTVKGLVPVCVATARGVPPMNVTVTFALAPPPVCLPSAHPVSNTTRIPRTARTAAPHARMHPPSFLQNLASLNNVDNHLLSVETIDDRLVSTFVS